ncbi:hypothetical protein IWZ01DRAFT_493806 [Phyllosticta capitalensis]
MDGVLSAIITIVLEVGWGGAESGRVLGGWKMLLAANSVWTAIAVFRATHLSLLWCLFNRLQIPSHTWMLVRSEY